MFSNLRKLKFRFLLHEKFGAGTTWKLVEWNQLSPDQKQWLLSLQEETEIYGLFCPAADYPLHSFKVAYREVAMIFLHLQDHQTLPHYFVAENIKTNNDTIAGLVLDHILEIEWQNQFVSGSRALPALQQENLFLPQITEDFNATLSMDAIRYAWLLDSADVQMLAYRLYTFNTIPWDFVKRQSFRSNYPVKQYLFGKMNRETNLELRSSWFYHYDAEASGWYYWSRYKEKPALPHQHIHKLYISPFIHDMPAVIEKALPVITASSAIGFKTGNSLKGLLRPDKMIVYFEDAGEVFKTASDLEEVLHSYLPQGVPFTRQAGGGGLLSAGVDPPAVDFPEKIETGSWRTMIANELALGILQSKNEGLDWEKSVSFIRSRLLSTGIDPENWQPVN